MKYLIFSLQASRALREASDVITESAAALQLRYLQVSHLLLDGGHWTLSNSQHTSRHLHLDSGHWTMSNI